jgi:hypothetical protein
MPHFEKMDGWKVCFELTMATYKAFDGHKSDGLENAG